MVELPSECALREEEKYIKDVLREGVERCEPRG